MHKKFIVSVSVLAATLASSSPVLAHKHKHQEHGGGVTPYVGADAQWRHMNFKKGYGENLVKDDYPQGNVYFGVKFNEYVGVEGGYESSTSKTRGVSLLGSEPWFSGLVDDFNLNETSQFSTTTKIKGAHFNIVGFLPINNDPCLQLIGSVGIAQLKIHVAHTIIALSGDDFDGAPKFRNFIQRKWVPRVVGGLQHMINNQFGVRATVGWENTSRFKAIKVVNTDSDLIARTKNTLNFGFGFFYNFK